MIRQEVSYLRYEFSTPLELNHFLAFIDFLIVLQMMPYCKSFIDPYELTVIYNETTTDV